jgi:hypothetical protein
VQAKEALSWFPPEKLFFIEERRLNAVRSAMWAVRGEREFLRRRSPFLPSIGKSGSRTGDAGLVTEAAEERDDIARLA